MGALFVKVGGSWVPISAGIPEEVFIGPSDPGLSSPYDLWIDSDAPSMSLPAPSAYTWHSQAVSVASASGVVTYLTQSAALVADGFHLGLATGVTNNTAICDQAGRYLIEAWVSQSAAVAGNIWNQLEIRVMRAGNPIYSRIFVGPGCPSGQYAGIAGMMVADLLIGDAIQLAFTAGGAAVTIDNRTHLVITSTGGAKGQTGAGVGDTAWTPYTAVVTAATTNPNIGSTGQGVGAYVVQGKTMHWRATVAASGTGITAGSGAYFITLPPVTLKTAGQITGHGWMYGILGFVPVVCDNAPGRLIRTDIAMTYLDHTAGFSPGGTLSLSGTCEIL